MLVLYGVCSPSGATIIPPFFYNGNVVLVDDREERAGVKFNDMDLIGIPVRITVGKKIGEGIAEIKLRNEEETRECKIENVVDEVKNIIKELEDRIIR